MVKPNFLILCTDQQRADSLGCCGNLEASTPNLDGLAARGSRFTRHTTPNQICSPSRGTMITGLYPRHHGMTTNGRALPDDLPTLPGLLAEAGWRTHCIGKLHLQPIMAPLARAMPESELFWDSDLADGWSGPYYGYQSAEFMIGDSMLVTEGGHYARWLKEEHPELMPLYRPEAALDGPLEDLDEAWTSAVPADLHYNTWIADRAADFLETVNEPFCLFVSSPDPHHPFCPPRPWADMFDPDAMPDPIVVPGELDLMAPYMLETRAADWLASTAPWIEDGGMAVTDGIAAASLRKAIALTHGLNAMIDDAFGRVLATLDKRGLTDNTIVVFTSDHGEFLGDHGLLHKGPPPYRQLREVTFLMAGPGAPEGAAIDTMTSHLDIMPTLLDLAGLGTAGLELDGRSFQPLLEGDDKNWRDAQFLEYHAKITPDCYNHSILTDDWRLTLYPLRPEWGELFDLNADPGEHRNLFADLAHDDIRDKLAMRLAAQFGARPEAGGEFIAKW